MNFKSTTNGQRLALKDAWVDWLASTDFDFAFTANFNRETTLASAERVLRRWGRDINRKVLGRRWRFAKRHERLLVIGFPEHPDTNLHYHLLVRAPTNPLKVQQLAVAEWNRRVPSGELWTSPLPDAGDVHRFARYALKDASWNGIGFDAAVIITGR